MSIGTKYNVLLTRKTGSQRRSQPNPPDSAIAYCRNKAAPKGSARYYASASLSEWKKKGLYALHGLDNAIFSIPFLVKDPALAATKLQWWRQAIEQLFGTKNSDHPILRALVPYLHEKGWSADVLTDYIDHTTKWLTFDVFQTQRDYFQHIQHTAGNLNTLAFSLLASPCEKTADFARHVAIVTDTAHFMTHLPLYCAYQKFPFALSWCDRLNIQADKWLKAPDLSTFIPIITAQLPLVAQHIQAANALYPPKTYPKLRYFRIMMQTAKTQLERACHHMTKTGQVVNSPALLPIRMAWIAKSTR